MTKLKLDPIIEDKPVKVTVELPGSLHRNLVTYAGGAGPRNRPAGQRSPQAHRAHAGAVHRNGQRVCQSTTWMTETG